jgi:hypothetical protein
MGLGTLGPTCLRTGWHTHQLDVVNHLLFELLKCPLSLRLQGEREALKGLVLAFDTDLCLHLRGRALVREPLTCLDQGVADREARASCTCYPAHPPR